MTNEEFNEKWSGVSVNPAHTDIAVKLIIEAVESLEYMDVIELAEEKGWPDDVAEAAFNLLFTPLTMDNLKALYTL